MLPSVTSSLFSVYPTESIAVLELRNPRIDVFQLLQYSLLKLRNVRSGIGGVGGEKKKTPITNFSLWRLVVDTGMLVAGLLAALLFVFKWVWTRQSYIHMWNDFIVFNKWWRWASSRMKKRRVEVSVTETYANESNCHSFLNEEWCE